MRSVAPFVKKKKEQLQPDMWEKAVEASMKDWVNIYTCSNSRKKETQRRMSLHLLSGFIPNRSTMVR